jgi:hypothetical protein
MMLASAAVITLWMAGAIYYDVCRATDWGRLLAIGWAIGVTLMLAAWRPLWQPFAVLLGITALFLGWWLRQKLRTAFLDYIEAIKSLHETPRWYQGLCMNCTTTFYQLPHSRFRWDWRVLANGRLDRALYEDGRLDRTLPFQELRRIASLHDIANSAPENGFGDHIRRELERCRHER